MRLRPSSVPTAGLLSLSLSLSLATALTALTVTRVSAAETPPRNGAATRTALAAPTPAPPVSTVPRIVEVRLGVSARAAESLSELRLRRLLELEIDERAVLAPGTSGPLGEHVTYVWIDLPSASKVAIEVRVGERQVARREIAITGLAWDVAARIVAITTSEMIRSQMQPVRVPRRPPTPKRPTPEELEVASRANDALLWSTAASVAFLPQDGAVLGGPSVSLSFRRFGASERLFGSWLAGPAASGSLRWLEAGLGADYRLWLSSSWRVSLGAAASLALAHLTGVRSVDGVPHETDTWSARAVGVLGVEAKVSGPLWLGLALEPGAILRPVRYEDRGGDEGALRGAWLGANLSLSIERREQSPQAAAR